MTSPRRLILHPSLVRPALVAGGERGLVIALWTTVFAVIFGAGIRPLTVGVGLLLGVCGQLALIRAAKADPQWWTVYRRHLRYHDYYPAHGSARAAAARVVPSVPR